MQAVQPLFSAPTSFGKKPGSQCEQNPRAGAHALQTLAPSNEFFPAAQIVHSDESVRVEEAKPTEKVPGGQLAQKPPHFPRVSSGQAGNSTGWVPGAHMPQAVEPLVVSEYRAYEHLIQLVA
jgi:hypothetical protein